MRPFFKNTERRIALEDIADEWIGTPFMPFQCVKQGGCDCVHLIHALAIGCGFNHAFNPPQYTLDATAHRDESMLHDYLDSIPGCKQMDADASLMVGDLITFYLGRAPHHLGMMVKPPTFIHCMRGLKTVYAQINDPTYTKRIGRIYRLFES